jgi:hypothetical protein
MQIKIIQDTFIYSLEKLQSKERTITSVGKDREDRELLSWWQKCKNVIIILGKQ